MPRDTGVRDFTAPGGQLFDLHRDGRIFQFNGSVPTPIGSHARSVVSDATGNVFALTSDGTIWEQVLGSPGAWNGVNSGDTTLVSDATGNVFALNANGNVFEHTLGGAGNSWAWVFQSVRRLFVDVAGNVFAVTSNGLLNEHTLGAGWAWPVVGPTVGPTAIG